jgi:hypothetical protein
VERSGRAGGGDTAASRAVAAWSRLGCCFSGGDEGLHLQKLQGWGGGGSVAGWRRWRRLSRG